MIEAAALLLVLLPGPAGRDWRPAELRVAAVRIDRFDELEELAFKYLGRPYAMGGVGSPAFDCSGYVCRVFAEGGYPLPRVSRDQARVGVDVSTDRLLPGDLLFFAEKGAPISHVGIYLGDGEMVHASSTRGEVMVADLSARWFRNRLVGARRILTSSTATTAAPGPAFVEVPATELVEHASSPLLPMLRRPAKLPSPSFGPELFDAGRTSIGIRSALITEEGILGVTLAPEGTLTFDSIALSLSLAVPVRFELNETPTVGTFERTRDYFRFLRSLSLGLPGADVELSFSRLSDYGLAGGFLLRHFAPGVTAAGVPGLSVDTSPLTFYGGVRTDWFRFETLIDDVFDPAVAGAGATVPLGDLPIEAGAAWVTDQKSATTTGRRAINGLEADLLFALVDDRAWSFDVSLQGAATRAFAEVGLGASLLLDAEWRFGGYDQAISLEARGSYQGPRSIGHLFGPTYVVAKEDHLLALERVQGRPVLGGELALRLGRFTIGGSFGSGVGSRRDPLDRTLEALLELRDLEVWGTRFFDLRIAYAARAPFEPEHRADVIYGSIRFRWASWLGVEVYLKKGETYEGGGGLTMTWMP